MNTHLNNYIFKMRQDNRVLMSSAKITMTPMDLERLLGHAFCAGQKCPETKPDKRPLAGIEAMINSLTK